LAVLALGTLAPLAEARTLTAAQARELALEFNRTYLAAKEDVRSAGADVAKARAGAFPDITLNGSYNRNFDIPSFFVSAENDEGETETIEFKTGFKNSYSANLMLTQSIWQGGKVLSAWKLAKEYAQFSTEASNQVERLVVFQADSNFYAVALQQARLEALEKSHEAAVQNLDVVEKQYSQGLVSEFEALRARVEKLNLEPQIVAARSNLRLAEKRLKSFLGFDLEEDLQLIDEPVSSELPGLRPLPELTQIALVERPEMHQAELESSMRERAIRIARGDYYPSLSAVASYDWQAQSDDMTLSENISKSWTAGLRLSIPIFRGGRTRGNVTQAIVERNKAQLHLQQVDDDIRLQVEAYYDRLLQAKEAYDIQQTTIAQAEEGLRIADLRYESGVGTLLEVLSARAALTQARQAMAEATFAFRMAKSGLKLATTVDMDTI
jgi:outer membrane protein TolC